MTFLGSEEEVCPDQWIDESCICKQLDISHFCQDRKFGEKTLQGGVNVAILDKNIEPVVV